MTKAQTYAHKCSFRMTGAGVMKCQNTDCNKVELAPAWLRRSV